MGYKLGVMMKAHDAIWKCVAASEDTFSFEQQVPYGTPLTRDVSTTLLLDTKAQVAAGDRWKVYTGRLQVMLSICSPKDGILSDIDLMRCKIFISLQRLHKRFELKVDKLRLLNNPVEIQAIEKIDKGDLTLVPFVPLDKIVASRVPRLGALKLGNLMKDNADICFYIMNYKNLRGEQVVDGDAEDGADDTDDDDEGVVEPSKEGWHIPFFLVSTTPEAREENLQRITEVDRFGDHEFSFPVFVNKRALAANERLMIYEAKADDKGPNNMGKGCKGKAKAKGKGKGGSKASEKGAKASEKGAKDKDGPKVKGAKGKGKDAPDAKKPRTT